MHPPYDSREYPEISDRQIGGMRKVSHLIKDSATT